MWSSSFRGGGHPRPKPLRVLVVVRFLYHKALAQIYTLENMSITGERSLHLLNTYFVYSSEEAPGRSLGDPFVKYHGLVSRSLDTRNPEMKDYLGIQISLMKYEDFGTLIDPNHFCCGPDDVKGGLCAHVDQLLVKKAPGERYRDVQVYSETIRFADGSSSAQPKGLTQRLRETGVYILMISNCGPHPYAVVSGSVVVKNAYGFLPGNEFPKLLLYGWLLAIYVIMAVLWLVLSLRWWKQVFNIQKCIAGVILLCLVECLMWLICFSEWNSKGTRTNFIFALAILSSVAKSIFSYIVVLVAALGWGVTRPFLDKNTILRIKVLFALYILPGVAREVAFSHMDSHSLSVSFMLSCLLPVLLLNNVIFYWTFTALATLIQTLKERGQTVKLQLFQRLWGLLVTSLCIASGAVIYQIFYLSRSLVSRWMHQWLFTDGISHILFLAVLAMMMSMWAPSSGSQGFAFSAHADAKSLETDDGKQVVRNIADARKDEG